MSRSRTTVTRFGPPSGGRPPIHHSSLSAQTSSGRSASYSKICTNSIAPHPHPARRPAAAGHAGRAEDVRLARNVPLRAAGWSPPEHSVDGDGTKPPHPVKEPSRVTVQPIRLFGDPVLRTPAEPVVDFDAELRKLVADLTDTMREQNGAGLAAPQLGVGLRVFTFEVDDVLGHLITPVLSFPDEEEQEGPEGCLSIPGLYFDTKRRL